MGFREGCPFVPLEAVANFLEASESSALEAKVGWIGDAGRIVGCAVASARVGLTV